MDADGGGDDDEEEEYDPLEAFMNGNDTVMDSERAAGKVRLAEREAASVAKKAAAAKEVGTARYLLPSHHRHAVESLVFQLFGFV
jgi:hypothetical protein